MNSYERKILLMLATTINKQMEIRERDSFQNNMIKEIF